MHFRQIDAINLLPFNVCLKIDQSTGVDKIEKKDFKEQLFKKNTTAEFKNNC